MELKMKIKKRATGIFMGELAERSKVSLTKGLTKTLKAVKRLIISLANTEGLGKGQSPYCRGSITIFLALIFVGILAISGIIIDAARIMVAEKRVQSSLDSAVRSGMAGYHADLIGEFGLYGQAPDAEILKHYFLTNLTERHENIRLIKYEDVNLTVQAEDSGKSLLNEDRFKAQVLEYMKYKAPLIIGESVSQKILEVFGGNRFLEETGFASAAQKAIQARKDLKSTLAILNSSLTSAAGIVSDKTAAEAINEMGRLKGLTQNEIMGGINAYAQALHSANNQKIAAEAKKLDDPETENLLSRANVLIEKIEATIDILHKVEKLESEIRSLSREENIQNALAIAERIGKLSNEIAALKGNLPALEEIELVKPQLAPLKKDTPAEKEAKNMRSWLEKQLQLNMIEPSMLIEPRAFERSNDNAAEVNTALEKWHLGDDSYYMMRESFVEEESFATADFLAQLARGAGELLRTGRDRLYITEYVLDKYTFLTSSTLRQHYFKKGEVEYILCGDNSELTNLLNIFGQTWFFRYALNTLASFVKSSIAHPLARLAYSLANGFFMAWHDVIKLYSGEAVDLIPGTAISDTATSGARASNTASLDYGMLKVKYSDHLRIFLLLQNEKIQLERMRQLIQVNLQTKEKAVHEAGSAVKINEDGAETNETTVETEKDAVEIKEIAVKTNKPVFEMKSFVTSSRAEVMVEINLWFIPALRLDVFGLKQFQGNKYRIIKSSAFSYES